MLLVELAQGLGQEAQPDRRRDRHLDRAGPQPSQLCDLVAGTPALMDHQLGMTQKGLTEGGKGHPLLAANQQGRLQLLLEVLDGGRQRGLRQAHALGDRP